MFVYKIIYCTWPCLSKCGCSPDFSFILCNKMLKMHQCGKSHKQCIGSTFLKFQFSSPFFFLALRLNCLTFKLSYITLAVQAEKLFSCLHLVIAGTKYSHYQLLKVFIFLIGVVSCSWSIFTNLGMGRFPVTVEFCATATGNVKEAYVMFFAWSTTIGLV